MECKYKKFISRWNEKNLGDSERSIFEPHLKTCLICQKELQAYLKLENLLSSNFPKIDPSPNFDAIFWEKVLQQRKESWLQQLIDVLKNGIAGLNLSHAFGIVILALVIGGTGGTLSTFNLNIQDKDASVLTLSGFDEIKGVPLTSIAGTFLSLEEKGN